MQCEPKHLFIYYRIQSQNDLNTDYLYLHYEKEKSFEEERDLPVYLGLRGKTESPHFVMNTILVDRSGSLCNRNFSKVKVSRLRFLPNNVATRKRLKQGNMVQSRAYLYNQRKEEKKALLAELELNDRPKITSKEF